MKVVFCLPGKTYSREFLMAWTDLMMQTASRGHHAIVSQQPTITECLSPLTDAEYDVAMFIGSDIIFRPEDFFALLESPHDITTGLYLNEPTLSSPEPMFAGVNLKPDDVSSEQYMKVERSGLGWLLVRKDVVNDSSFDKDTFVSSSHDIYVDTKVRVGHRVEIVI